MNWKYLAAFTTTLLVILLFAFATRKGENKNFEKSKNEIVIRKIGHEICCIRETALQEFCL